MKNKKKNPKPTEKIVEEIALEVKDNRVYLDKDGTIHWEVVSQAELDDPRIEKGIQEVLDAIFKLAEKTPGKVKVLMDFHRVVHAGTAKARKMLGDALKTNVFYKVAVIGVSVLVETAAKFVMAYARIKFVKFFKDKKKALKWLKE